MDYYSVSCNRGAPVVSRGGFAAYDLNPGRWVGPGRLAPKKARLARWHCVASTHSESLSRPAHAWPGAEASQIPYAHVVLAVACGVLEASPFSMN